MSNPTPNHSRQRNLSNLAAPLLAACMVSMPLLCTPAAAQSVNKCVIDGRTVFQASSCPAQQLASAATAQTSTAAEPVPAPSAASAPKKKTLSDVLRERDQNDRPQSRTREFQSDGANVLRSRMGAF